MQDINLYEDKNIKISYVWNSKVVPLNYPENPAKVHSQKNSPADKSFLFTGKLQDLRHSAGEMKHNKEKDFKALNISEFNCGDEENDELAKNVKNEESFDVVCRICLDSDKPDDFISPCSCRGFQKFVHQACLKAWLMRNDSLESNFCMCEICKDSFLFQFEYSTYCSPFSENSCRAWIPFVIACIMFSFIACFIVQDYIDNSTRGLVMFSVCIIFGFIGLICSFLTITNLKLFCLSRKVSIWRILSKSHH